MSKTAIITGAGSGVGRATALAFDAAGWRLALIGRRREALEATAAAMAAPPLILPTDMADPGEVDGAFDRAADEWGRIDLLFNNAGRGSPPASVDETPVEDWLAVIGTNLTGAFLGARAAFRHMRAQAPQGGRIVNNGSISAHMPRPGSAPYTASKHGVTGLTRTLSLDGRRFNIACGQIDIGNAATEMTGRMADGVPQADGSTRPEPVFDVRHVADAVLRMGELPLDTNVQFMTIMARDMPYVGRG